MGLPVFSNTKPLFVGGKPALSCACKCDEDLCQNCVGNALNLKVDFTNVTTLACTECSTYYTTASFIVPRIVGNECRYEFQDDPIPCVSCSSSESTSVSVRARYGLAGGSTYFLECDVSELPCDDGSGVEIMVARFRASLGSTKPNCVPPSTGIALSPFQTGLWNPNAACTWSTGTSTCKISSTV